MNQSDKLVKNLQQIIGNHIAEEKVTIREMANEIGIDPTTFSRKWKGKSTWRMDEMLELIRIIKPQLMNESEALSDTYQ
ncbi:MAG: hypothetical protein SCK57_13110 [Bacillota bacterium]|nr:hypothetical protein [Bacillota bacterium]MDW7678594.1 hypothetical protein [Bacillota bacterium]